MNIRLMKKKGIISPAHRQRKTLLEKITERIGKVEIQKDEKGKYIHVCEYHMHPGAIGSNMLEKKGCNLEYNGKCCKYYKKYRRE